MGRNRGAFRRGYVSTGQVKQHLTELGEEVLQAAKDALKAGADTIVKDAKTRVPVKTGKLKDSIKAVAKREGTVYEIEANATDKNGFPYGQIVEFSPKINRPFLYPAFDENYNAVRESIIKAIQAATRKGAR